MTQLIIVYVLGALLLAFILFRLYQIIFHKDKRKNFCHNCPSATHCKHYEEDNTTGCDVEKFK